MSSNTKASFFRQGGWMVVSTFLGGIFMVLVQRVAKNHLPESEFNTFNALLRLLIVFGGVPAAALQSMFAQQSAAAVSQDKVDDLVATTRAVLRITFFLWIVIAGLTVAFTGPLGRMLGVANPGGLRLTVTIVLSVLWLPILKGLLQGLHRFTSLGWLQILEGGGRCLTMQIMLLIAATSTGGVFAVLAGQYVTLATAIWLTRDVWGAKSPVRCAWKKWLATGIPLTLGMGSIVFMQSIDTLFVKSTFTRPDQVPAVGFYVDAMLTGYAIIMFIAPITNVMFPRLVRSLALAEKSDALTLTVVITGVFACLAAVGCTLLPGLPLRVIFGGSHLGGARFVPWFAWALLPLTMANVLIQNLLARQRFTAAPFLIMVPVLYAVALVLQKPALAQMADMDAMIRVIQTLGCSCLALFGVAAFFTWRDKLTSASGPGSAAGR